MHNVNWPILSIHLNNRPAGPSFKAMSIHQPRGTATRPARTTAKALVAVLAAPDAPLVATAAELARWRALTPLALWSAISVRDASPDEILHGVAAELARQDAEAHQLILLAEGKAARTALEVVLQGTLDCAGLLAIAISCAALPFRVVPTAAAIRLVVQHEERGDVPVALITALHAADIDTRITSLNRHHTRAAASAAETLILELVANASRQSRHQIRHGV
jgi:hypothetical protein